MANLSALIMFDPPDAGSSGTGSNDRRSATSNINTKGSAFADGGGGPSLPAVTVPSGCGSLRSMEEAFDLSLVTGTASLGCQVPVTKIARWGTPDLELMYSSGGGLSSYGIGWELSGLESITRSTKLGFPTYLDEQDIFEYDGDELVPVFAKADGKWTISSTGKYAIVESSHDGYTIRQYKRRVDKEHQRIERWTSEKDPTNVHWRVLAGDNTTRLFGYDMTSRTASSDRIFSWHYCQGYDGHGNAQMVQYKVEDSLNIDLSAANERNRTKNTRQAQVYPKRILYGNKTPNRTAEWVAILPSDLSNSSWLFELVLDYGEHDKNNPQPNDDTLTA